MSDLPARGVSPASLHEAALNGLNVAVSCPGCARRRVLASPGLWWLFRRRRWDDAMAAVAARLWCEPCRAGNGGKIRPILRLTTDAPTGDRLPVPDEREWRLLAARYRN